MSTAVIIGGGDFPRKDYPRELLRRADHIVCCDGGALKAFLRNRGKIFSDPHRLPDAVVGDMDSMTRSLADEYSSLLIKVEEQDDNDQTKALRYILDRFPDVDTIHILAATGKREDHTVGNLGLLMEYARSLSSVEGGGGSTSSPTVRSLSAVEGPSIDIVSDHGTAFAITDSCDLILGKGRRVSLFSPDNSLVIKSKGLVWPTDNVVFDNWWQATLNRSSDEIVSLTFSHKSIALLIVD